MQMKKEKLGDVFHISSEIIELKYYQKNTLYVMHVFYNVIINDKTWFSYLHGQ